jgi:hypothetical protein
MRIMRTKKSFFKGIFFTVASCLLGSCSMVCIYKELTPLDCSKGYIPVEEVQYFSNRWVIDWVYPDNQLVKIDSDSAYKQAFGIPIDSVMDIPFDFAKTSMLAVKLYIDYGTDLKSQQRLCFNPGKNIWFYKIEYTLHHQCKDGYSSDHRFFYLICPKLPADANILLDDENINPCCN